MKGKEKHIDDTLYKWLWENKHIWKQKIAVQSLHVKEIRLQKKNRKSTLMKYNPA